jgi:hypothetical protein
MVAYRPSSILAPIKEIFMTGSSPPCLPILKRKSLAFLVWACLLVL